MRFSWAVLPFIRITEIDAKITALKRLRGHQRDRSKRKKIEIDICYLQRERKCRDERSQLHQQYLKKNKK